MIGAVSTQVGVKEEQPDLLPLKSPPPSRGFDQALRRADHKRPGGSGDPPRESERANPTRERSRFRDEESRAAREGEAREAPRSTREGEARDDTGRAAGARDKSEDASRGNAAAQDGAQGQGKSGEKVAGEAANSAATGTGAARPDFQEVVPEEPLSEADQATPWADGKLLTPQQVDPEVARRQAQAANLSGFGRAAYEQSPHGLGEGAAAAGTGLQLAGAKTAARRGDSQNLEVAAQGTPDAAFMEHVDEEPPPKFRFGRQEFAEIAKFAQADPREQAAPGEPRAASDPGRLALLNAMRQPPLAARATQTAAAAQATGELPPKTDGERTSAFTNARGLATAGGAALAGQTAGASATAQGALARPDGVDQPFVERVAHEVRWMIRNDRNEATIRMEPEHLGALRIKVTHADGTLRIDMTVESQHARAMLESRLNELREQLAGQDLGGDGFSFNVNVQDQGKETLHTAARFTGDNPYSVKGGDPKLAEPEPQFTAARAKPLWGESGAGIYV